MALGHQGFQTPRLPENKTSLLSLQLPVLSSRSPCLLWIACQQKLLCLSLTPSLKKSGYCFKPPNPSGKPAFLQPNASLSVSFAYLHVCSHLCLFWLTQQPVAPVSSLNLDIQCLRHPRDSVQHKVLLLPFKKFLSEGSVLLCFIIPISQLRPTAAHF